MTSERDDPSLRSDAAFRRKTRAGQEAGAETIFQATNEPVKGAPDLLSEALDPSDL